MRKMLLPSGSLALAIFGFVISNPLLFKICKAPYEFAGKQGCSDDSIEMIGEPILLFGVTLLVLTTALVFFEDRHRSAWMKFAAVWLPLSAILIAITPTTSNTPMPLYFFGREAVTWIMTGLFLIISLLLIAFKSLHKPR